LAFDDWRLAIDGLSIVVCRFWLMIADLIADWRFDCRLLVAHCKGPIANRPSRLAIINRIATLQ